MSKPDVLTLVHSRVSPLDKVAAFRCLNQALDAVEIAASLVKTSQFLYPGMDQKYYIKIRAMLTPLVARVCHIGDPQHE